MDCSPPGSLQNNIYPNETRCWAYVCISYGMGSTGTGGSRSSIECQVDKILKALPYISQLGGISIRDHMQTIWQLFIKQAINMQSSNCALGRFYQRNKSMFTQKCAMNVPLFIKTPNWKQLKCSPIHE